MSREHPGRRGSAERTLVVWCPDWPVVAAGVAPDEAAAVVGSRGGRVVACSPAARGQGVRRGLRRREAEGRCPGLRLLAVDPDGEARAFEAVAAALEALGPRLEVLRPGTAALPTRGPSRYLGGDAALAERAAALGDEALTGRGCCRVGVADGLFAAVLAARRGVVVDPGGSAAFLAPFPVAALDHAATIGTSDPGELAELADLLRRLGLRTLGEVAALPSAQLAGRFGPAGTRVATWCRGLDDRPPRPRVPPPDLTVAAELDPPADRVEAAAFVARALATELGERLAGSGRACTRVRIEAETEHGETLSRRWRTEGLVLAVALVERVRWQLDGWCNGTGAARPTGGITVLRLVPEEVHADRGRQLGFWGGATAADERAARGIARLQGLLGPEGVTVPRPRGGRGPLEQVALVPAHAASVVGAAVLPPARAEEAPWPGRIPPPSPALLAGAEPVEVLDATGAPVAVTGRGLASAAPQRMSLPGGAWVQVVAWAGPWPVDERWWDPVAHSRRARIQVVTATGEAHLVDLHGGCWTLEATYD
ncbi:MAG: DNA polymerase Y family protein [Acidimicrobiia bacterium]